MEKDYLTFINSLVTDIKDDKISAKLVLEFKNKIKEDKTKIFFFKQIIDVLVTNMKDSSNLLNFLINNDDDINFVLELMEIRINSNEITELSNNFFANKSFNTIVKENLLLGNNPNINLNRLTKIALANNNVSLLKDLLKSRHIKQLNIDTVLRAQKYLIDNGVNINFSSIKKDTTVIPFSKEVLTIYKEIFVKPIGENITYISDKPEDILKKYSRKELKMFISSLNNNHINLTNISNSDHDLLSAFILYGDEGLSMFLLEKDNYKQVNDKEKNKSLNNEEFFLNLDFLDRSNANLLLSTRLAQYDLTYEIINSNKFNCLDVYSLFVLINTLNGCKHHRKDNSYMCTEIINLLIEKISNGKIEICRPFKDKIENTFILTEEKSLTLIRDILKKDFESFNDLVYCDTNIIKKL